MRYWLIILLLMAEPAVAVQDKAFFEAGLESFHWSEYDGGDRLLEESGSRAYAVIRSQRYKRPWLLGLGMRVYGGTVDYDGQLYDLETGAMTPYRTDTEYTGYDLFAEFVYQPNLSRGWGMEVLLGRDFWRRNALGPYGYIEDYAIVYLAVGPRYSTGNWTTGVGLKRPISSQETVGLQRVGFVTDPLLHPKGRTRLYAHAAYRLNRRWSITADLDGYRFDPSEPVSNYYIPTGELLQIWQPESHQDTVAIGLRYRF